MKESIRRFIFRRVCHFFQLALWGIGLVLVLKFIGSFGGSKFELKFDGSDRNAWIAAGLAVVGIWIGMSILEWMEHREKEASKAAMSNQDADSS